MRVHEANRTDAAAIAAVHVSSWEGAYRGLIPDEALDRRTVARQTVIWDQMLGASGDPVDGRAFKVLVAVRGTTVIGFVSVNVPSRDEDAGPDTAEISALYVDPEQWRQGAGTALMDAALAELTGPELTEVTLWVLVPNVRGLAFYTHAGFADDGGRRSQRDGWPTELRMRREL